jgi:hypothetical protein
VVVQPVSNTASNIIIGGNILRIAVLFLVQVINGLKPVIV